MPIDYQAESQRLNSYIPGESSEFWKPKPGQYRIRALSEIEPHKPFEKEGKEPQAQAKLSILVDDKHCTWTFAVGKSPASTYAQLVNLAAAHHNQLSNVDFMVVVNVVGMKRSFTVVKL